MCGNGIRCVAKYLHDRGGVNRSSISIDTGAGRLSCAIDAAGGKDKAAQPTAKNGQPVNPRTISLASIQTLSADTLRAMRAKMARLLATPAR